MRTKISLVGNEARDRMIAGAEYLANCVSSTLGPFGKNVFLEHGHKVTNDGFSISSELANTLENEFERQGAISLHNASAKSNDETGDATTTAIILALAIIKEAVRLLPNDKNLIAKKKPSEILKMIEDSKLNVIEKLKAVKTPITTLEQLIEATKVSVEDDELAQLIGKTQWEIGKDGFILAEDTIENKSYITKVKGIRIDNGFAASNLITDQAKQQAEIDEISVFLTNYTIDEKDIVALQTSIINPLLTQKKNRVAIVARAFTPQALQLCQKIGQSGFLVWCLNAPYTDQAEIMKDLACITGATYYDQEERRLEDLDIKDIGWATKILSRRFDGIITGCEDNPLIADSIQKRITELETKMNGTAVSDFEKKAIAARISMFKGGFALLKVGAETIFERQYKLDKAEDGVNTARLALQEGTIKGGGLAFKEISDQLADDDILKRPLLSVYNQIMTSAPQGFEIEDWVRDSYLTLVSALKNACSIAGQFCNIAGVVTTEDPKQCSCSKPQDNG